VEKPVDRALVWFRRDLRADDQAALYHALKSARKVWCAFVFDRAILDGLPRADRRVEFIHDSLLDLDQQFAPKAASRMLPDGRMVSAPLEDLAPFLDRDELQRNMLIPVLEQ